MGNASSRVKKRVPRNLRRTKSFQGKAKKHEISDKEGEQAIPMGNRQHSPREDTSTIGKKAMYIGYDLDAEVLDIKETFEDDVARTTMDLNPPKGDENYHQGKLETEELYSSK